MEMVLFWAVLNCLFAFVITSKDKCKPPLFGKGCHLKCNCDGNICIEGGNCPESAGCLPDKFGPLCQYDKIKILNGVDWLKDDNDSTCNPNEKSSEVTVEIHRTFTWARMIFRKPGPRHILVSLDSNITCQDQTSFDISNVTTDISCSNGKPVTSFSISGPDIGYLCTLYISGGRNIALNQAATISTVYFNRSDLKPSNAVDGRRPPHMEYKGQGCTHTDIDDPDPRFALAFQRPHLVHTIRIFSRTGSSNAYLDRMARYKLHLLDASGNVLFKYRDNTKNPTVEYKFETGVVAPVSGLVLLSENSSRLLNFCEIEVYGDAVCEKATYGPACEHRCDYCLEGACRVETGACTTHCLPGKQYLGCNTDCNERWYGLDCLERCIPSCMERGVPKCTANASFCECNAGSYGIKCEKTCPDDCKICDNVTGACLDEEEVPTSTGGCPEKLYGPNCSLHCSETCQKGLCHSRTGVCDSCFPGFMGEHCSDQCNDTYFGLLCSKRCSDNCLKSQCNHVFGMCLECPTGFAGEKCDEVVTAYLGPSPMLLLILTGGLFLIITMMLLKSKDQEEETDAAAWEFSEPPLPMERDGSADV